MTSILLTQYQGAFLGPVAKILGVLMNGIFNFIQLLGLPNIGLAIILFTIVIYIILTPLTVKQQKFSKLSAKMNPEIQAIQKKYKNKKDNDSMMRMNEETKAVYEKYGTSPTGSCLPLLIQMPLLLALWRVINNIPAYVTSVKEVFTPFVTNLMNTPGAKTVIEELGAAKGFAKYDYTQADTFIDVLNKLSTAEWSALAEKFPSLSSEITDITSNLAHMNNFLGINIGNSPSAIVSEAIAAGAYLMVVAAIAVPVLSALTQWLNTKLMPTADTGVSDDNPMASSMKTMNVVMPIMSAVFCYTLPVGMGIYWIAGAVIRSVQQLIINKYMDKVDVEDLIKKNVEKVNKKREKKGLPPQKVSNAAKISTRTIQEPEKPKMSNEEKLEKLKKTTEYYNSNSVKPGSLASKANMVRQYNEKNNK